MTIAPFITTHSIERYRSRVDPAASRTVAIRKILDISRTARARSRPRHWTCVDARPGCRYLYSAQYPGICLVERDGAIITVFSRSTCACWKAERVGTHEPVSRPPVYRRPPAGAAFWIQEAA